MDFPEGLDKYKWFARFLLEGKVTFMVVELFSYKQEQLWA